MILSPKTRILMLSGSFVLLAACKPAADARNEAGPPKAVTAPAPAAAPEASSSPLVLNGPAIIHFGGFGVAKFGANEESVRMSWGRPLKASKPSDGSTCYYLNPDPMQSVGSSIGFMFEDNKFVRYDVEDASQLAPGNFKVGDTAANIMRTFAGRIEQTPHKYIEKGFTLTVTSDDKSDAKLVFEIGEDGRVINWRIGNPPQIFYVEGCS